MNDLLTKTIRIIFKHYIIGLIAILIGTWIIGEIPKRYTIERDRIQWIVSILSIPLIGLFFSWRTKIRLERTEGRLYFYSALILFLTWILTLYSKAIVMGLYSTFEKGQVRILEAIVGYTIYQLWIYGGLGFVHGLLGGILLNYDLKKNLEKI